MMNHVEYQALAEFRRQIRKFLRFSESAARAAGLEPRQHQMLLAIHGLPPEARATVGEMAARLQIEHHSTVELATRLARAGYLKRCRGGDDRREVLLCLTPKAEAVLRRLAAAHAEELHVLAPALLRSLRKIVAPMRTKGQRDKGTATQRDKGTEGQRDKETKGRGDAVTLANRSL
jgi:DNA-binding MarR family transcriptional regulator